MREVPARTVAVLGAVCVTVGWLVASTLNPPVAQSQSLPERAERERSSVPPADLTFAEQLHLRMRQAPSPPDPRRNPFTFAPVRRPAAAEAASSEPVAEGAPPAPAPSPGPRFRLSGIGVTGEHRTAVLADGQTVHIVAPGDTLAGLTVVAISDDSVTLAEPSGLRLVLRLR